MNCPKCGKNTLLEVQWGPIPEWVRVWIWIHLPLRISFTTRYDPSFGYKEVRDWKSEVWKKK